SSKNIKRPEQELEVLNNVFKESTHEFEKLCEKLDLNVKFIGDYSSLKDETTKEIKELNNKNPTARLTVYICLGYDGRQEIIDGINRLIKNGKKEINEEEFRNYLYDKDMIDPEIIIRTSGVSRLSGFLLYQATYSELFFVEKLWPEITTEDVDKIIEDYQNNVNRKFGK
ncbi:MAG: polyprenyl diphosphate synthase, partial [archaeon]